MREIDVRPGIHRDALLKVAELRLDECQTLIRAGHYTGAFYLAGYVLETLLKRAICVTLDLEELPRAFHTHRLEPLLVLSGFQRQMRTEPDIIDSFHRIAAVWHESIRYEPPGSRTQEDCRNLMIWLNDPQKGVIPWLKQRI